MSDHDVPAGTYYIKNVALGKLVDLANFVTSPGNPIIGWEGNDGRNQKWVVETSGPHHNIRSLVSTDAYARSAQHCADAKIISGKSEHYELVEQQTGQFRIKIKNQNLYWVLRDAKNGTQIELQPAGWGNDLWYFNQIDN